MILTVCIIGGGYFFWRIVSAKDEYGIQAGGFFFQAVAFVGGALGGALLGSLLSLFLSFVVPHTTRYAEIDWMELVALDSTSEMQGTSFLASGSIGSQQYYKLYTRTLNGENYSVRIKAKSAVVYEENRKDAYIAGLGIMESYPAWIRPLFYPFTESMENRKKYIMYAIHIPKGTIKRGYNLD